MAPRLAPALLALVGLAALAGCHKQDELIVTALSDAFDRAEIGDGWRESGGSYRIENGELLADGARHHPLWLRKRLPPDVAIEFDARTTGDGGDIRIVLYGDGKSANPDRDGCQSSGYALVFGGWKNKLSVLCRGDQADGGHLRARADWPVVAGRDYHFYVTRKGGLLSWYIAGHEMTEWNDPKPLGGPGHEAFGFDGGNEKVYFDNLTITPLRQ
jgi:hypothetical protein